MRISVVQDHACTEAGRGDRSNLEKKQMSIFHRASPIKENSSELNW